ncbi:PREDICTED: uncharacterized protein LOC104809675 [Tarenaya hassleriana]|uniref:uncharacterized protein LOC104809675 n=1 Tax=Tarenaya hassleriana TaxID=28532 RepID=UPI00053C69CC|nr:PREDICTED: uncharacterized protein LOC104809675 [Tarenaya hassleriana]
MSKSMSMEESSRSVVRSGKGIQSEGLETTKIKEGSVSLQYPLLTKTNYTVWAMKMEIYMQAQGVWDAIELEGSVDKSKDKMTRAAICQGISEETLLQIGVKRTAKEAWDALKMLNHGADKVKEVKAQSLRWELEGLKMEESESVDEFTGRVSTIINKLKALGESVNEGLSRKLPDHLRRMRNG